MSAAIRRSQERRGAPGRRHRVTVQHGDRGTDSRRSPASAAWNGARSGVRPRRRRAARQTLRRLRAGGELRALAGDDHAAGRRAGIIVANGAQIVWSRPRAAFGDVVDRQPRATPGDGSSRTAARWRCRRGRWREWSGYSRTTSVSPSETDCPSSQRISVTTPGPRPRPHSISSSTRGSRRCRPLRRCPRLPPHLPDRAGDVGLDIGQFDDPPVLVAVGSQDILARGRRPRAPSQERATSARRAQWAGGGVLGG